MATGEAECGATGLPLAALAEQGDGAVTDVWEDWPAQVWDECRSVTEPLSWNRVQRIAAIICRENRLRYGRESSARFKKLCAGDFSSFRIGLANPGSARGGLREEAT